MLDLFITHYDEPWDIGEPGFLMLAAQRCVDWDHIRVTLVHDGTEPFPDGCFARMPCKVNQVSIPHGGIAAARNWCIDHAEGEWIKWNDFDDMFANCYALRDIMNVLGDAGSYDLLWFDVYAELATGRVYIKDDRDPVVLHGKVFRTEFLKGHGIRFNENLIWCEDSAFLSVVEMEIDHSRIGKIQCRSPIYLWLERMGSLCNRPEIKFDNLKSFFERHKYVQQEFKKRGLMEEYRLMTVRTLCDSYYTLCLAGVKEDTTEHERNVRDYYFEHIRDLARVSNKDMQRVIDAVNKENRCSITRLEFMEWIKQLRKAVM